MKEKKKRKLFSFWSKLSLQTKMNYIAVSGASVILLSITASLLVAGYGMRGFSSVLKSNSQSLALWSAIENEKNTFASYIREQTKESYISYEAACKDTKKSIEELSYDYKKIGRYRYAKVWSIRNLYKNYSQYRDNYLFVSTKDQSDTKKLYTIYRLQGYLTTYAGQLEQMTVKSGNERYEKERYLLVILPVVSLILGALSLLFVRLLKQSVHKSIIRPVIELAKDSVKIGQNDFSGKDIITEGEGEDEIAKLVTAFARMKSSTKGYINALTERHAMEKQLEQVRLQMLKNQINPHFLFNTLNMISSTAQIEDAETTEKMISALSSLFRYNLKSTDSVMPLERELKVVRDYMYLQQMRFGQRIRYKTDCDPETLDILIPSFSLQPLVENAVMHGLSSTCKGGIILIRSWIRDGRLWISVADTGVGIPEEKRKKILESLKYRDEKNTGIGVGNIYRRVHGMYSDGDVFLYSSSGKGTAVQLAFTPSNHRT
ncbi:histidine kinase [Clostridium sp. E02]|uniref:sensor histidine kinase n=1 Tax=Clostridium sp. E02 TaxID=2487134 RepID=UPI000F540DBE|nr:histidine kinase [Clostridium sp. E02]